MNKVLKYFPEKSFLLSDNTASVFEKSCNELKKGELIDFDLETTIIALSSLIGRNLDCSTQARNILELSKIDLSGKFIRNLEPLRDLSNLQELDLSNNEIEDASPIFQLKNLKVLDLSQNRITTKDQLEKLKQMNAEIIGLDNQKNLNF